MGWFRAEMQAKFDELRTSGDNRKVASIAACGTVAQFGSALPWHGRGRRFDPDQVHQINPII